MSEFKLNDASEINPMQVENFKTIQPENGMTLASAVEYWDNNIYNIRLGDIEQSRSNINEIGTNKIKDIKWGGYFTSYKLRLDCLPKNKNVGKWEGEIGESKFVPSKESDSGLKCIEKLAEFGVDGIEYRNCEPDFSRTSEGTVNIDNMTEHRQDYFDENGNKQDGNFTQADKELAKQWNEQAKDGRTDWNCKSIEQYRHDNNLSWHERCDTKTMDLISRDIHAYCKHSGGVVECKARDSLGAGGNFDE